MALLNESMPRHIYGYVRSEFLHNLETGRGLFTECVIFGATSQANRALSFHIALEDGSSFAHIPLHALCHKPDAPFMPIQELALWDCFGHKFTITEFAYFQEMEATAFLPHGPHEGIYVCSFDWFGNGYSDHPEQHKTMHMLALENGNFCLQPNNRLRWHDASFTVPWDKKPAYKTNTHKWHAE